MEYMPTLDYLKEAWHKDLGLGITGPQRTTAQDNVHSSLCLTWTIAVQSLT